MSQRSTIFADGEFYHVYNKTAFGVAVFNLNSKRMLKRVLGSIDYYRYGQNIRFSKYSLLTEIAKANYDKKIRSTTPLVAIHAFSIMPNHFHFLLRQNVDIGVTKFISNFQNSFAKYYNTSNDRYGSVFQGPFKAKHIEDDKYLLHLSRYIHLNPVTSYIIDINELKTHPWNSFSHYTKNNQKNGNLIETNFIIKMVGSTSNYTDFVYDREGYQKDLKRIKNLSKAR